MWPVILFMHLTGEAHLADVVVIVAGLAGDLAVPFVHYDPRLVFNAVVVDIIA